jgi:hypothetical protein
MLEAVESSSTFSYSVFSFVSDDARETSIPIGVALWSAQQRWWRVRFLQQGERLSRFNMKENFPFVTLIQGKLNQWMQKGIPYEGTKHEAFENAWWKSAKNWLIHRIRLSDPRPIDCIDPDREIEPLYESVVSPGRGLRDQRARVISQINQCLAGLEREFKKHDLAGFGGSPIRASKARVGPSGTVVVEGVIDACSDLVAQASGASRGSGHRGQA